MLLHSAHHPKDIYINKLQEISNTTCKHKFKERLKIDKFMITYHNPDNLRKIVLPSSSKECDWLENSATYHADTLGVKTLKKDTNIAKRAT